MGAAYHLDEDDQIDKHIRPIVAALRAGGVETFESCEGGPGHAYPDPTVRFFGDLREGLRAYRVAVDAGFGVAELRQVWPVNDGNLTGPWWELTFVLR